MLREVLHSKIHLGTVTGAHPNYVGSITIDADILEAIGLRVNDKVTIANCSNGARLETYVFKGEPGSKKIELNGASARLIAEGDKVIVLHYAFLTDEEYRSHRPTIAIMGEGNRIEKTMHYEPFGG